MLTIIPRFLRQPTAFFESVRKGEAVGLKLLSLAVSAIVFLATYGFVMGLPHSLWQALSSAAKMPILFVATVLFCLPAFYFFSLVLQTPLNLLQVATVVLVGVGVTAFLLLGLSPITLFFVLTSKSQPFFQLLAVAFVGVSGCVGIYFLWRGMMIVDAAQNETNRTLRHGLLGAWFALYGFVGTQMTWRLSPFIGDPASPFALLQPSRDNFYMDVLIAFERTSGLSSGTLNVGAVWIGMLCLLPLGWLVYSVGIAAGRLKPGRVKAPVSEVSAAS